MYQVHVCIIRSLQPGKSSPGPGCVVASWRRSAPEFPSSSPWSPGGCSEQSALGHNLGAQRAGARVNRDIDLWACGEPRVLRPRNSDDTLRAVCLECPESPWHILSVLANGPCK